MNEVEIKSGYFNAELVDVTDEETGAVTQEPDITYLAEDLNTFLEGLVSSKGIFAGVGNECEVITGSTSNLSVIVRPGKGLVNNHWFKVEASTQLELEGADVILNRIDRIVVRCDTNARKVYLAVLTGELAETPVAPSLSANEISLAKIYIGANKKYLTAANITSEIPNTTVCGWITGLVDQVNTTALFNQYEAALNEFTNGQTTEFYNWFNEIKEEVKATSIYRVYEEVYKTTKENEYIIPIPSSINYTSGIDNLEVFIEGRSITPEIHYTVSATNITLFKPLSVLGTEVKFRNGKSIDGTAAESVVVQVNDLQDQVNALVLNNNLNYTATGTNDNITLSNIVKNFLNGTGEYSSVKDNASMLINVQGELGIQQLIDDQMIFDFHSSEVSSNRRVIVDFGNATINYTNSNSINLFAVFGCDMVVEIRNANIYLENMDATTIYGFHGGVVKECRLTIYDNNSTAIYGAWDAEEVSNSKINIHGVDTAYGTYECKRVQFNDISVSADSVCVGVRSSGNSFVIGNYIDADANSINSSVVNIGNIIL